MRRLDLLVPALLADLSLPPEEAPRALTLERVLGRADRTSTVSADPLGTLLERFGISPDPDKDLPSAPFSRLADAPGTNPVGFWLHADPVHLRADRDRLLLFDSRSLGLVRDEADALVGLFNAHFAAEGLVLEAPVPERWYLRGGERRRIRTQPLHEAVGRSVDSLLPRGADAGWWNGLLNEVQMLFHQSEANKRREQEGRPLVNGIWVWGGGSIPDAGFQTDLAAVCAGHPLARGLAIAAGVAVHPLLDEPARAAAAGRASLVFWDSLWFAALDWDASAWARELARLDAWSERLVGLLGRRGLAEIDLYPCEGSLFRVNPAAMRRFWRRRVAFGGAVARGAPR